jgi:type II secretory pathway pseudopilin PulG
MKKSAFTMIELIFIIVVLGILASIAIPKLAATRDDAVASKMAANIMTGSFECASYAVAKGKIDPTMSNMSPAIKQEILAGNAVELPRHVSYKMGTVSDCVMLDINQSTDGNTEEININFGDPGGDNLCLLLQDVVDTQKFPIPLKGSTVVR